MKTSKVLHTLRQAFCDQSDGRTRSEAVATLLLSENYLATETAATTVTPGTTALNQFLDTREAFRLDADVSALARPQVARVCMKEKPIPVTGAAEINARRPMLQSPFPEERGYREGSVSVESVLREVGEKNQRRKRRLLRRQKRNGMEFSGFSRRRQQRNMAATGVSNGGEIIEKEHPSGDSRGSDEDGEQGSTSDDDLDDARLSPPQQYRSNPSSCPSFENVHDPGSRLALAASVSTLSGLLESSGKDRGDKED